MDDFRKSRGVATSQSLSAMAGKRRKDSLPRSSSPCTNISNGMLSVLLLLNSCLYFSLNIPVSTGLVHQRQSCAFDLSRMPSSSSISTLATRIAIRNSFHNNQPRRHRPTSIRKSIRNSALHAVETTEEIQAIPVIDDKKSTEKVNEDLISSSPSSIIDETPPPFLTIRPGPGVTITKASDNTLVVNNDSIIKKNNSKSQGHNQDGRTSSTTSKSIPYFAYSKTMKSPNKNVRNNKTGGLKTQILGRIRSAAAAGAISIEHIENVGKNNTNNDDSKMPSLSKRISRTVIQSSIVDILDKNQKKNESERNTNVSSYSSSHYSMGLLGERELSNSDIQNQRHPIPGSVLVHPTDFTNTQENIAENNRNGIFRSTKKRRQRSRVQQEKRPGGSISSKSLTVRVATYDDDVHIANLRLSVFSDFSPELRDHFCLRSCQVLASRRRRGATCLVATVPQHATSSTGGKAHVTAKLASPDMILGSAECSIHEFDDTELGLLRPEEAILYITEVAVHPNFRRLGIGRKLLDGIDELASIRNVETLYLHVDVKNKAALTLYENSGYKRVTKNHPMFDEFTTSLNLHDGATKGRNHYLLYKHLTPNPTWLKSKRKTSTGSRFHRPVKAENDKKEANAIGFEIPASIGLSK